MKHMCSKEWTWTDGFRHIDNENGKMVSEQRKQCEQMIEVGLLKNEDAGKE